MVDELRYFREGSARVYLRTQSALSIWSTMHHFRRWDYLRSIERVAPILSVSCCQTRLTLNPGENVMKKIVVLIVLFAVCTTFLLTTEVLVAQDLLNFVRQEEARQADKVFTVVVCVIFGVILSLMVIASEIRHQTKKQNEQREKHHQEMMKLLDQKIRENRSSDSSDK
jgi:hypothetical protein